MSDLANRYGVQKEKNIVGTRNKPGGEYETIEFPSNLGEDKYPYYVIFYINSNTKATITKKSKNIELKGLPQKSSNQGLARDAGAAMEKLKTSSGSVADMLKSFTSSSMKRLLHAIVLHMPHQVRASYSTEYDDFTNGGIAGSLIKNILAGQSLTDAASSAAAGVLKEGIAAAVGGVGAAVGVEGAYSAIQKARGEVENPRAEILFKSVGFRRHEFNYIFAPKNEIESETVKNIIKLFKFHMHPEILDSANQGQYLAIPSEFDIEYYYKENENDSVGRIATCVLESCNVDYTPNGSWSAFDETPHPVHITMSLQFRETEPLYRNMIELGY